MAANVGAIDRIIRIMIGVVLIALALTGPRTPWGWIGVIPLATALINFCPLYALIGITTRGGRK